MIEDSAEDLRPPATDRRTQQRLPLYGTALVRIDRREMRADTVDISAHGVCLTLPRALEVGSTCQLELEIHGELKRSMSVVARVCFCLHGQSGYRIGLHCSMDELIEDSD